MTVYNLTYFSLATVTLLCCRQVHRQEFGPSASWCLFRSSASFLLTAPILITDYRQSSGRNWSSKVSNYRPIPLTSCPLTSDLPRVGSSLSQANIIDLTFSQTNPCFLSGCSLLSFEKKTEKKTCGTPSNFSFSYSTFYPLVLLSPPLLSLGPGILQPLLRPFFFFSPKIANWNVTQL